MVPEVRDTICDLRLGIKSRRVSRQLFRGSRWSAVRRNRGEKFQTLDREMLAHDAMPRL